MSNTKKQQNNKQPNLDSKSAQKKLAKNRASSLLARYGFTPKSSTKSTIKSSLDSTSNATSLSKNTMVDSTFSVFINTLRKIANRLFLVRRLKAFITDIFMLYTPILYIATYVVLGSAEKFRDNQLVIFICFVVYAMIYAIFIAKSGQTPGLKYANLKLIYAPKVQKNHSNDFNDSAKTIDSSMDSKAVGFCRAFLRVILWALGVAFVFGVFSPLFLSSRRFFYDALTSTELIDTD